MQLKSFYWFSHHGIWAIIPCSTNMVSKRVIFDGPRWLFTISFPTRAHGIIAKYVVYVAIAILRLDLIQTKIQPFTIFNCSFDFINYVSNRV